MLPVALNFRTMISPLPSRAVYTQRKVPKRGGPKHTTGGPDAHQSSDQLSGPRTHDWWAPEADIHPFPKQRGGYRLSLGFHINLVVIDFGVRDVCRCWAITELRISGIFRLR